MVIVSRNRSRPLSALSLTNVVRDHQTVSSDRRQLHRWNERCRSAVSLNQTRDSLVLKVSNAFLMVEVGVTLSHVLLVACSLWRTMYRETDVPPELCVVTGRRRKHGTCQ